MIKKIKNIENLKIFGEKPVCRQVREAMMRISFKTKKAQIILVALLVIFTIHPQFIHLALARSSGGGDLAEFDTGKFVASVGIGLASSAIGNVVTSGIGSALTETGSFATGATNAISNYGNIGSWASSYNSMAALNQLGAVISMYGQQQGWDVSQTVLVSSMVTGAVGGGLNPTGSLGSSILSGTIAGTTEGAILANNIDKDGTIKPWVNAAAGMTGALTGGITSAYTAKVIPPDVSGQKFHMADDFGEAFTHGAVKAFEAIPSELIGMGVSSITKDMDKQDAFMVRQSFRGLYPIAGSFYKYKIQDPAFRELGVFKDYTGQKYNVIDKAKPESLPTFTPPSPLLLDQ